MNTHIRFDWAMKRLLRQKANFGILEGFILVKNSKKELMLIEVQNDREFDFFHRMNYGQAKLLTEHMHLGMKYDQVKKIYSINIVYFDLGQGDDYIYKGKTEFRGIHTNSVLQLSEKQKKRYNIEYVSDIYTTYYVLKVNQFDDVAENTLDQWMYFLKHAEVPHNFTAQGLAEAQTKLRIDNLDQAQKERYQQFVKSWRIFQGTIDTYIYDGVYETEQKYAPIIAAKDMQLEQQSKQLEKERKKAEEERKKAEKERKKAETANKQVEKEKQKLMKTAELLLSLGIDKVTISEKTGLSEQEIEDILTNIK